MVSDNLGLVEVLLFTSKGGSVEGTAMLCKGITSTGSHPLHGARDHSPIAGTTRHLEAVPRDTLGWWGDRLGVLLLDDVALHWLKSIWLHLYSNIVRI